MKDVYIRKMVKVCDGSYDRWSLFTLNNNYGRCVELKFVNRMRRQFEFSVDSFQVRHCTLCKEFIQSLQLTLDPLLDKMTDSCLSLDSDIDTKSTKEKETSIIVPAESMYGDFRLALRHLNERLIDTRRPEEIRGGGLLKVSTNDTSD